MSEEWTRERVQKTFKELGFEIPKNEDQLKDFNEKFKDYPHKLTGKEIDPQEIWEKVSPMNPEQDKEIEELSREDALDSFREMVGYSMQIDDKETIDNYADTFMLIADMFAKQQCKKQREICVREWFKAYESENEGDAIRNAPEPK